MLYKKYGKTNIDISSIGFGGMRFKEEDFSENNYDKCAELVLEANKLGINYFDTAPDYCHGHSERIMGTAFKQMKREDFYVSTKCGLWNAKNADEARAMIEQSLTSLNVDYLDFYNMWCSITMEQYQKFLKPGGVFEGALKAKEEGLIKNLCFTTHMSGEDIAKIADDGIFEGVTLGYNALNFKYRQIGVDACHKANMAITVMNPLGGGIIPAHPDYFSFIKQNKEDSIAVSALKFLTSQEQITIALCGISSMEELKEDVLGGENVTPATKDVLDKMSASLNTELNALCTGCTYCDECPVGVPIPQLVDSYNNFILTKGDIESVTSKISGHWNVDGKKAADCINCGKCEKLCTQKLPIMKRLAAIAAMY